MRKLILSMSCFLGLGVWAGLNTPSSESSNIYRTGDSIPKDGTIIDYTYIRKDHTDFRKLMPDTPVRNITSAAFKNTVPSRFAKGLRI